MPSRPNLLKLFAALAIAIFTIYPVAFLALYLEAKYEDWAHPTTAFFSFDGLVLFLSLMAAAISFEIFLFKRFCRIIDSRTK